MKLRLPRLFALLASLAALSPIQVAAQGVKRTPVKLIYGAITAANGPIWVADDQGLFEKHGLDLRVVHARGAAPVQATVSGAVEFGHFAGVQTVAANLSGSDLVFVAAQTNYAVLSVWTRKDSPLKSISDLTGKSIAVGAPASASHTTMRLALRKVGIVDKDVKYIHHGSQPELFVSLDKGLVDASVSSAPRPGYNELVDLAAQRIPLLQGAIIVRRAYLKAERPTVLNFVKAFIESIHLIKQRPEVIVASLVKHLRVKPDIAKEAYRSFAHVWEDVPYVRAESVQTIIDLQPKELVKDITPERYIDNSLVKELESSGFIKSLARK
jgi:ABC-type nitrate/sulfonate/bicarbonate transport system substrate-binding protein